MTIYETIDNLSKQCLSCDYHKVKFREAVGEACDKLANEYIGQHKIGLITWAELGRQLERLQNEKVELFRKIND